MVDDEDAEREEEDDVGDEVSANKDGAWSGDEAVHVQIEVAGGKWIVDGWRLYQHIWKLKKKCMEVECMEVPNLSKNRISFQ